MTTTATPSARPAPLAAVLRAETRLFLREPGSLFWILVFPTALMTVLGLIPSFREADDALGGRSVIDLYVPVAVLLAMIMAGLQAMPPVLTGYRERGILRRMSATPVRPSALLAAQIVLHGAAALGSAALVVAVGRTAFGVRLPGRAAGYLLALLLAVACVLALGATICALSRTSKVATAAGSVAYLVMMFTAGVWVPVQTMPDLLRRIVEFTPFGAASQALDQAASGHWPGAAHLAVVLVWTAVPATASTRLFRWE
ncbi:ABC transporter permease [Streptomyces sp. NPDC052071]|uniref:Transport permease protein n=1 Tax=Streptomyces pratensis (strain ATCC 33331 / IAF-45CD) TaxID=591167 RepID=A0A8D3WIW9_STRFA|nr:MULTISPECIES: ABC transporter permease [Streptomyces]MBD2833936.1 ABC transporter permease [Streptomyces pratensis]TPN03598.1 ABC transporter permease [Mesorhizobium sp. B2-3-3]MCY1653745.1 ABC transporter permease [Streptomyces sp. SL203]MCY1678992.1 ABC transporter permease [Streptomyces sp. SL294]MDF6064781.1 ABC transporter permease [Streptomyces sp. JH010]